MEHILKHFRNVDPIIYKEMLVMDIDLLVPMADEACYFGKLCHAIIGQQLAEKAADAICGRFDAMFPDGLNPAAMVSFPGDYLRQAGLSWAKVRSVRDLAEKIQRHEVKLERMLKKNNEAVITELIKVKGIGRWTAEMFLMFTLGREDVFSFGDLGLKKGFMNLYGFNDIERMQEITSRWSPYRSYGSLALWHSLESI